MNTLSLKEKIRTFISSRIDSHYYSAAQVLVAHKGKILVDFAMGYMDPASKLEEEKVSQDTLFNLESITKVMVTLPLAFYLMQEGNLCLEDKIVDYIPEFGTSDDKKKITVRDMLNFTAGIPLEDPDGAEKAALGGDIEKVWNLHFAQELSFKPVTKVLYSDVSCRIFGKVLEKIMNMNLAEASKELIFNPLGMVNTMFNPPSKKICADTGVSGSGRKLRGELTQDLEHYMGGVLGSDGLFSNAHDMLLFSQMLLGKGIYDGKRILGKNIIERMTNGISNIGLFEKPLSYLHYILSGPKVWFWEYAHSPYSFYGDFVSDKAIGKMGGAGTFLLIDPDYDLVVIYLTNYGQPAKTLVGEQAWYKFQKEINMMGLCNLVIGNLAD